MQTVVANAEIGFCYAINERQSVMISDAPLKESKGVTAGTWYRVYVYQNANCADVLYAVSPAMMRLGSLSQLSGPMLSYLGTNYSGIGLNAGETYCKNASTSLLNDCREDGIPSNFTISFCRGGVGGSYSPSSGQASENCISVLQIDTQIGVCNALSFTTVLNGIKYHSFWIDRDDATGLPQFVAWPDANCSVPSGTQSWASEPFQMWKLFRLSPYSIIIDGSSSAFAIVLDQRSNFCFLDGNFPDCLTDSQSLPPPDPKFFSALSVLDLALIIVSSVLAFAAVLLAICVVRANKSRRVRVTSK